MTRDELSRAFAEEVAAIAPEADMDALDPEEDLRDALELDSMDILNLAVALSRRFGIDIPEADYTRLVTVDDATGYLAQRLGASG
jgi:acyl carrier protein